MASAHPRRTTKTTLSAMTPSSLTPSLKMTMTLRKGATFHNSPTSPTTEQDHQVKTPSLPRRSQTTLEDVVDAHKRRVALTLGDIDRGLANISLDSPPRSFRDEASPVPTGIVMAGTTTEDSHFTVGGRSLRPRRSSRRSPTTHASDSGLGESVRSSKRSISTGLSSMTEQATKRSTSSAITRSAASTMESVPRLSERATNRITEHILRPLLSKASLKDFHPLVQSVPEQIHKKEIITLRDLEKTFIFKAPERAKTAKLYLDFCITSIRCIQATVEFLHEREQTRPNDRPYTNGYFVDLVDQIRSYAQQVQMNKEKESNGEALDEMDAESSDEVKLYGGLSRNGRPAELVRVKKNGTAVSIATGKPVTMQSIEEDEKGGVQFKRSLSEELAEDEAVLRSMARRKRSASAAELAPKRCREPGCTKEFKRSCDLTKHEKTHSRPFKCPEDGCKYQEYGWPTEKELDRHINDKHSSSPTLYKCQYAPCAYKSKRESNCKQHMEKAHGWTYVRSKNNGKNRSKNGDSTLPTPQTTNHRTPDSDNIPTPDDEDYDIVPEIHNGTIGFNHNVYNDVFPEYPMEPLDPIDFDFNAPLQYVSPVDSNQHYGSISSSGSSPFLMNNVPFQPTNNIEANYGFHAGTGNDFMLYGEEDIYNAQVRVQIPAPNPAVLYSNNLQYMNTVPLKTDIAPIPHISPSGHGNTMLYTPTSLNTVEDSFEYEPELHNSMGQDFPLFASHGINHNLLPTGNQFGEIPSAVGGISQSNTQDFFAAWYNSQTAAAGTEWLSREESLVPGFHEQH